MLCTHANPFCLPQFWPLLSLLGANMHGGSTNLLLEEMAQHCIHTSVCGLLWSHMLQSGLLRCSLMSQSCQCVQEQQLLAHNRGPVSQPASVHSGVAAGGSLMKCGVHSLQVCVQVPQLMARRGRHRGLTVMQQQMEVGRPLLSSLSIDANAGLHSYAVTVTELGGCIQQVPFIPDIVPSTEEQWHSQRSDSALHTLTQHHLCQLLACRAASGM